MNTDDLRQAGNRHIDAMVADQIMGVRCFAETRGDYTLAVYVRDGQPEPWKRKQRPDPERYREIGCVEAQRMGFHGAPLPRYTESIADAWKVAERMKSGLGIVMMLTSSPYGDAVSFVRSNMSPVGMCKVPGEIEGGAARSICVAALRAWRAMQ